MSSYNVPFTSTLQMWSPSPSIEYNFNSTATTSISYYNTEATNYIQSRLFHHEPVLYPSACIICGLAHHPVPHTQQPQQHSYISSPIITTPAPLEPTLLPSTLEKSTNKRRRSHTNKRQIKPHKKLAIQFKSLSKRCIKIISLFLKAPLMIHRRHNIYPVKQERVVE